MREKRKPSSTKRLDDEKRMCLSWNMYDAASEAVPSTSYSEAGTSSSQKQTLDSGTDPSCSNLIAGSFSSNSSMGLLFSEAGCSNHADSGYNLSQVDLLYDTEPNLNLSLEDEGINSDADIVHVEVVTTQEVISVDEPTTVPDEFTLPNAYAVGSRARSPSGTRLPYMVTQSKYDVIKSLSEYEIAVKFDPQPPPKRVGLLATYKVHLSAIAPTFDTKPLPHDLPAGPATLFFGETPGKDFLIFDAEFKKKKGKGKGVSRKDRILGRGSALALAIKMDRRPGSECLESLEELHKVGGGKLLCLHLHSYFFRSQRAVLDVWLMEGIVVQPAFAAQPPSKKKHFQHVHALMSWFHSFPVPVRSKYKVHKRYDYNALFDRVRRYHQTQEEVEATDVQHPALVPVLRQYQKDAVSWMVMREKVKQPDEDELHVLWRMFKTVDDKTLYYNLKSGEITAQRQVRPSVYPGGILADEMGLGKTVEVLATILAHPRWDNSGDNIIPSTQDDGGEKSGAKQNSGFLESSKAGPSSSQHQLESRNFGSNAENVIISWKQNCGEEKSGAKQNGGCLDSSKAGPSFSQQTLESINCGSRNVDDDIILWKQNSAEEKSGAKQNGQLDFLGEGTSSSEHWPESRNCGSNIGKDVIPSTHGETVDENGCVELFGAETSSFQHQTESNCSGSSVEVISNEKFYSGSRDLNVVRGKEELHQNTDISRNLTSSSLSDSGLGLEVHSGRTVSPMQQEELVTKELPQPGMKGDQSQMLFEKYCSQNPVHSHSEGTQLAKCEQNGGHSDQSKQNQDHRLQQNGINVEEMPPTNSMNMKQDSVCTNGVCDTEAISECNTEAADAQTYKCVYGTSNSDLPASDNPSDLIEEETMDQTSSQDLEGQEVPPENSVTNVQCSSNEANDQRNDPDEQSNDHPAGPSIRNDTKYGIDGEEEMPTSSSDSVMESDSAEDVEEIDEPKVLQCLCGKKEPEGGIRQPLCVQCLECRTWQHAQCVNFHMHMPATPTRNVQYWCPHCFPKVPPLPSGATLIISPNAICHQWVDEINRHIDSTSLKVMVYEGVKKEKYIQPKTLAEYDIVITTYNTLRLELDFANLPHPGKEGRNLRHAKRYMTSPSPMPCIEWWRICLDEAQMIESPTAKSAEMANRLTAKNRWCVTGTPIQKSLDDLYGLFLFLGVEPFWVKHWWDLLLSAPYSRGDTKPLRRALREVFWRSAKKDVLEQIALPPQTEEIHWLDFTDIEMFFYKRKHEECSRSFTWYSHKTNIVPETKLSTLDRKLLQSLLGPLLRLRQACCHPHVVRGEFTTLQKKKQLSMKDLLTTMIGKAEVDTEGAHRQLVCALNGLAAIHCIKNEIPDAVRMYRLVLQSAEEHKTRIKTDKLQLMHAIHNMSQILRDRSEVVQALPEEENLPQRIEFLRDQYLVKTKTLVTSSLQTVQPIRDKVLDLKTKIPPGPAWYLDGIQWVIYRGLGQDLVERLKTELEAKADIMGLADMFRDARGFQFVLVRELDELATLYKAAWNGVTSLSSRLQENSLLTQATDCHLRPFMGRAKHTCAFCRVEDQLKSYEMKLFLFDVRNQEDQAGPSVDPDDETFNPLTAGPRGTWAASEMEKALRILHSFLRTCNTDENILEDGATFLEMLEQQRKEFKPLRAYWGAMRDRVAAMDELEMAMLRLRVKLPGEETDPVRQPYIIEPLQVDPERYKFLNDRLVAQTDLRKKLGQLIYLHNLCKAQFDLQGGRNPEPCPICVRPLGVQWAVLQCGHCFCNDCMEMMIHRSSVGGRLGSVKCAVCRTVTGGADVSYVSMAPPQDPTNEENAIRVTGDHSTKIEAVVRTLKMIQLKEPGAKAIVFSTWAEVLGLISRALTENNISFRNTCKAGSNKSFQAALMDFKQEPGITALLLPVHSGSKGLNIIEATHVLLVEPILNPASEMQAIGRVHRIGQNKPTVVHRFLVHETIEEKLHGYLRTHTARDDLNVVETDTGDMTLSDLRKLFASES